MWIKGIATFLDAFNEISKHRNPLYNVVWVPTFMNIDIIYWYINFMLKKILRQNFVWINIEFKEFLEAHSFIFIKFLSLLIKKTLFLQFQLDRAELTDIFTCKLKENTLIFHLRNSKRFLTFVSEEYNWTIRTINPEYPKTVWPKQPSLHSKTEI